VTGEATSPGRALLRPQRADIPVPTPSPMLAPYWEGCRRGELRHVRCPACGATSARSYRICEACGGRELRWEAGGGRGRLYSWTVVWRPQHPAFSVPYAPAIVTMDEGHDVISAVVGCGPDDLTAGMALTVEFHPASADIVLPYFGPAVHSAAS
jgi:uncharacterized OB-fold protein